MGNANGESLKPSQGLDARTESHGDVVPEHPDQERIITIVNAALQLPVNGTCYYDTEPRTSEILTAVGIQLVVLAAALSPPRSFALSVQRVNDSQGILVRRTA